MKILRNKVDDSVKPIADSNTSFRRLLCGTLSVMLVASMMLATGCSSRSDAQPTSSAGSEPASSSAADDASSEEASSEVERPKVELLASATKYHAIDSTKLATVVSDKVKVYKEEVAKSTPTSGNIAEWKKVNSDVVGWMNVPGTNVDYPVVYNKNNNYYTERGYDKQYSHNGVIWLDQDTRFNDKGNITSTNTIIYGHNWTNIRRPMRIGNPQDVMLAQLAAYDYADFAKEHPYIYLNTLDGQHKYQVFSVFYTDLSFKYWFAESSTMKSIVDNAIKLSIHKFDVPMTEKDQFLTISTCTRVLGAGDNQRFVIMAKRIS